MQKIILILCICFLQYEVWYGQRGFDRWWTGFAAYDQQFHINSELEKKIAVLEAESEYAKTIEWAEHHGREKWGLVGKDETLVIFRSEH